MVYNRRFNRNNVQTKTMGCSCGSEAKLSSKKNYPFGVKSKGITSWFYKCKSCKLVTFQDKDMGGKK